MTTEVVEKLMKLRRNGALPVSLLGLVYSKSDIAVFESFNQITQIYR